MTLRDRTRAAAGIPENDPVLAAAMAAAVMLDAALENKEYLHSVGDLAIQSGILEILGKGALPPDIWKRKLRALAAIVVTDTGYPFEDRLVSPDRLGFFFTSTGDRLVEDLEKLGMDQATAQTLKTSADEQRNVRNIGTYPIIALERNALFEIAVKETPEDFASIVRYVLWHEIGHLVFNPDLSVESIDSLLKKPQGSYAHSKALQCLVEGSAEWFAFTAEAWNPRTKEVCADMDWESESPYSYAAALLVMPPQILAPVLLSFLFNCVRSALWYLPIPRDGPSLKLHEGDFGGIPFRGRDFVRWHSFADHIAGGVEGLKLGLSDLEAMTELAPELVREDLVSEEVLSFFGLDSLESGGKAVDFTKPVRILSQQDLAGDRFDDLLFYNHQRNARLWIGLSNRRTYRYLIAFSTEEDVERDGQGWYMMLQLRLRGESTFDIFSRAEQWKEPVLRRAAFLSWSGA